MNDLKKCPFCAEWILTEAIVCRYCNRELGQLPNTTPTDKPTQDGDAVCLDCEQPVYVERVTPGSLLITLVLIFVFFVPAIIYELWRVTARYDACELCGGRRLVPLDSPAGQRIIADDARFTR